MKHATNTQILYTEKMGKYLLGGGCFLYLAREEICVGAVRRLAAILSRQDHPKAIVAHFSAIDDNMLDQKESGPQRISN
jgi:hypothetical protein